MRKHWLWIAGAGLLSALAALVVLDEGDMDITVVEARDIRPEIVARARVDAAQGVSKVRSLVEGRLLEVLVHEGDVVEQGKLVAVIDNPTLEAELQQAEADLRTAEAELETVIEGMRPEERAAHDAAVRAVEEEVAKAKTEWERKSTLFERGYASRRDLDEASLWLRDSEARLDQARAEARLAHAGGRKTEIAAAEERVRAARAALQRAEAQFQHTRLVAPSSGTVVARRGNPGDIVFPDANQTPIVEVADLTALEIRIEVEQIDADALQTGLSVRLLDAENREHLGSCTLSRIGQRVQSRRIGAEDARLRAASQVRSAWCRVEPESIQRSLLLDQRLEAVVILPGIAVAATVPRAAIYIENGRTYVDVPGTVWSNRTAVTLGVRSADYVEVSGLVAGDEVIVPRSQ